MKILWSWNAKFIGAAHKNYEILITFQGEMPRPMMRHRNRDSAFFHYPLTANGWEYIPFLWQNFSVCSLSQKDVVLKILKYNGNWFGYKHWVSLNIKKLFKKKNLRRVITWHMRRAGIWTTDGSPNGKESTKKQHTSPRLLVLLEKCPSKHCFREKKNSTPDSALEKLPP